MYGFTDKNASNSGLRCGMPDIEAKFAEFSRVCDIICLIMSAENRFSQPNTVIGEPKLRVST
jgi:hypothetical protein